AQAPPGARLRAVACFDPGRARRSSLETPRGMVSEVAAPAVSVVIPTFNRARLLPEVLRSVRAQRACPGFEIVVIDDASTDDTAAVLAGQPDVRVVRRAHKGGGARARQTGVEHARGALLAFHDSDDLMLADRLGSLARFLETHPEVDAVYANGLAETDGGRSRGAVVPAALARRLDGRPFGVRESVCDGPPGFLEAG